MIRRALCLLAVLLLMAPACSSGGGGNSSSSDAPADAGPGVDSAVTPDDASGGGGGGGGDVGGGGGGGGACLSVCDGLECGDDGCGGSCGTCPEIAPYCVGGLCAFTCEPSCGDKICGDDGCGGSCGECPEGTLCSGGVCACTPSCESLECGDDGCGGVCGECPASAPYCTDGVCEASCAPQCEDAECGDDGCGGVCGTCPQVAPFCVEGKCAMDCVADCGGKECGDDGCGESCGVCGEGGACLGGACVCLADCTDKACGDDGCGGSCGVCGGDTPYCSDGVCIDVCTPDCEDTECGDDGCGGSCGTCPQAAPLCVEGACALAPCTPDCDGKSCGPDGCDGTCGACPEGLLCNAQGQCLDATVGAPSILVEPSAIDFDGVNSGEIVSKQLSIINVGPDLLEVTGFLLSGHPAYSFVYGGQEWPVSAETSASGITFPEPIMVPSGQAAPAMVRFNPMSAEPAEANLVLLSNDPAQAGGTLVKLSGNKSGACITINPKKVDFGGKLVGKVATVDVELHSCGNTPLTIRAVELDATGSGDFGLDLGNLPGLNPGTTALVAVDDACETDSDCAGGLVCEEGGCAVELGINQTATFQVTYVPDEMNQLNENGQPVPDLSLIHILTNTFDPELEVEVKGFGVEVECPTAVILVQEGEEVIPQTKLHLIGSQSYAASGAISKYEWSVQQPVGSQSIFLPSAAAADPTFEVNVAGTYVFKLGVWDQDNKENCIDAEYTVYVYPDEAIHVEALWDTPNDPDQTDEGPEAGADLDLHFAHWYATGTDVDGDGEGDGWFDQPFDCFWFNAHPQWGSFDPMIDDDPGLDLDDTDGAGPENVNLNIPEDGGSYRVGVHYWNDHGFGPSLVTVRIYIYSQLVFQVADVELMNHDMWEVVEIAWPSAATTVITNNSGGYKIIPNYTTPFSMQ